MNSIPIEQWHVSQLQPGMKASYTLTFAAEEVAEGILPVHVVKGQEEGPTLLIFGAVHGDEYEGVRTIIEMTRDLQPEHVRGTIIMVPVVNVLSYYDEHRTTLIDGGNLARVFPGKPDGTVTERLAWHVNHTLIAHADFLLDLHSGGTNFIAPELVGYYHNDDSEVGRKSRAAAEAFGMEVLWAHPVLNEGRTVSTATEHGVPWLYTEAQGGKRIREEEFARYRMGTLRLMRHLNMLLQPDDWIKEEAPPIRCRMVGDGNYDKSITAKSTGFFIPDVQIMDYVKKGQRIGAIYNWFGEEIEVFEAHSEGFVVGLLGKPLIQEEGMMIYSLTGLME